MRTLILSDKKNDRKRVEESLSRVTRIYEENASIKGHILIEERDFSNLKFVDYRPYDERETLGMDRSIIEKDTKEIFKRYEHEIESVMYLVHDENWLPGRGERRIWGWNMGVDFNGYDVHQCRYDPVNIANTIGTAYHEKHHSHPHFVRRMTGTVLETIMKVPEWGEYVTHGKGVGWEYIRYLENQQSITDIAPYLSHAIMKKKDIFEKRVGIMQEIIRLAEEVVYLYNKMITNQSAQEMPFFADGTCQGR